MARSNLSRAMRDSGSDPDLCTLLFIDYPLLANVERINKQKSKKPSSLISELQRGDFDGKPLSLKPP